MFNIEEMAQELEIKTAWQSTPYPVAKEDYIRFIVWAIKKLFVDINHPDEYDKTLYTTIEDDVLVYDYSFDILQEDYIFILAQMFFFSKVYSDYSGDGAISYTTDALSVTSAKEGYKSIQQELDALEKERIRVFHKMMAREES